ncbi:MAG: hypothetical protein JXQ29_08490 [Planctomycetes bacterium]|nr:hypothetical protein [Planctomycetota bacterium]
MPSELKRKLARMRGRARRVVLLTGAGRFVLALVALAALSYLLDRGLRLPLGVRSVLLVAGLATLAAVAWRALVRPLGRPLEDGLLAAGVEALHPELDDRLRSALDFAEALRHGTFLESRELAERVVAEALERSAPLDFHDAVRTRRAVPWVSAALAAVVLAAAGIGVTESHARIWLRRCVLLERDARWPRTTELRVLLPPESSPIHVTEEAGATVFHVPQGLDFTLHVVADRGDPPEVTVHLAPLEGGRGTRGTRVLPRVQHARYATTFERLTRSFQFDVRGGDDTDGEPVYRVRAHAAPAAAAVEVAATFPAYTGRPPRTFPTGDVEVPRDTELRITVETTQPVASALLLAGDRPPLAMGALDPHRFHASIRATEDFHYSFDLLGTNRMRNHSRVRYRVLTVADRAPAIVVERPRGTLTEVAPGGVMPLVARVREDHGARACRLRITRGERTSVVDLPDTDRIGADRGDVVAWRVFHLFRHLDLAELDLAADRPLDAGDVIGVVVEVEDNHQDAAGVDRPNVGRSKEIKLEVHRRADLERRVNDRQLRIKEEVRRAEPYLERTIGDAEDLVRLLAAPADAEPAGRDRHGLAERILTVERRQNRLTEDLRRVTGDLCQNLDTYVFNRLEETPATTRMLDVFERETRRRPEDDLDRFRAVAAEARTGALADSDVLSKLVRMVGIGLEAAEETSPGAGRTLGAARAAGDAAGMLDGLGAAVDLQHRTLRLVKALLVGLEDWEDYQEVIQLNKELIELQKEVESRTIHLFQQRMKKD